MCEVTFGPAESLPDQMAFCQGCLGTAAVGYLEHPPRTVRHINAARELPEPPHGLLSVWTHSWQGPLQGWWLGLPGQQLNQAACWLAQGSSPLCKLLLPRQRQGALCHPGGCQVSSGPRCRRCLAPQVYGRPPIPALLGAQAEASGGPLLGLPFTPGALLLRQAPLPPSSPWGALLISEPFHCQCFTYNGCSSAQQISDPVTQITAIQFCGMGMIIRVFLRRRTCFWLTACKLQRWESN